MLTSTNVLTLLKVKLDFHNFRRDSELVFILGQPRPNFYFHYFLKTFSTLLLSTFTFLLASRRTTTKQRTNHNNLLRRRRIKKEQQHKQQPNPTRILGLILKLQQPNRPSLRSAKPQQQRSTVLKRVQRTTRLSSPKTNFNDAANQTQQSQTTR